MPWDILQLDGDTATQQDVKRAYARLVKKYRPDQDPEGFRRLHDAFEEALERLRGSRAIAVQRVAVSPEETHATVENPGNVSGPQEPVLNAAERFEQALKEEDRAAIATAVQELERLAKEGDGAMPLWSLLVSGVLERTASGEEIAFSPEVLFQELDHGASAVTLAMIDRWDRLAQTGPLFAFGKAALEPQRRLGTGDAKVLMVLACTLARWTSKDAEPLADLAFPMLPPEDKQAATGELAFSLHLGQAVKNLPARWRNFWIAALENPEGNDWNREEAKAAIRALTSPQANQWPGRLNLYRALPIQIAHRLPKPAVVHHDAPVKPSYSIEQLARGPLLYFGIVVIIVLIRNCG